MKRHIPRLLLLGIVLLVAACQDEPHPADNYPEPFRGQLLQGDSLLAPTPQRASMRVFEDSASVVLRQYTVFPDSATADTPSERIMRMPISAGLDSKGETLYVMDTESFLINKYDVTSGELLGVITAAKDAHVPNPYSGGIRLINDEDFWVYGLDKARITRMRTSGEILDAIKYTSGEFHAASRSGNYVVARFYDDHELFHTHTPKDRSQASFGILTSEKLEIDGRVVKGHGLSFTGGVISDGSESFLYAASFGGLMLSYTMDGSLRYFRESIKPGMFPELVPYEGEAKNTVMTVNQEQARQSQVPLNVWNGTAYYAVREYDDEITLWTIDAYDYDTGDYLYSIDRRETCRYVFITDEHIYAHCFDPGGFVQFQREGPPDTQLAVAER